MPRIEILSLSVSEGAVSMAHSIKSVLAKIPKYFNKFKPQNFKVFVVDGRFSEFREAVRLVGPSPKVKNGEINLGKSAFIWGINENLVFVFIKSSLEHEKAEILFLRAFARILCHNKSFKQHLEKMFKCHDKENVFVENFPLFVLDRISFARKAELDFFLDLEERARMSINEIQASL